MHIQGIVLITLIAKIQGTGSGVDIVFHINYALAEKNQQEGTPRLSLVKLNSVVN
jgi:hypothetical protein